MATLSSKLSVIINYVPTYVVGLTAISNRALGTSSVWPTGLPEMIKTYGGNYYQAQFLDGGVGLFSGIVGTGSTYEAALTAFMLSATSSNVSLDVYPVHQMRTW